MPEQPSGGGVEREEAEPRAEKDDPPPRHKPIGVHRIVYPPWMTPVSLSKFTPQRQPDVVRNTVPYIVKPSCQVFAGCGESTEREGGLRSLNHGCQTISRRVATDFSVESQSMAGIRRAPQRCKNSPSESGECHCHKRSPVAASRAPISTLPMPGLVRDSRGSSHPAPDNRAPHPLCATTPHRSRIHCRYPGGLLVIVHVRVGNALITELVDHPFGRETGKLGAIMGM